MPRKLLGLSLLLLIPALQAAPALVPRPPALAAASWILVEASTGTVLVEHEADTALPPASLTKMMTDYVVAAELAAGRATLDDLVPISEKAWRMDGSKMFVRVGDQVRLEDLLRGVVIQSGNDASVALAEYLAGGEAAFSDVMNRQAALPRRITFPPPATWRSWLGV